MITLINPPGIKTFSGLQMHTPNPPLGLAHVAAALKEAGLPFDGIAARIHPDTTVIGIGCMFSTLSPLVNRLAAQCASR